MFDFDSRRRLYAAFAELAEAIAAAKDDRRFPFTPAVKHAAGKLQAAAAACGLTFPPVTICDGTDRQPAASEGGNPNVGMTFARWWLPPAAAGPLDDLSVLNHTAHPQPPIDLALIEDVEGEARVETLRGPLTAGERASLADAIERWRLFVRDTVPAIRLTYETVRAMRDHPAIRTARAEVAELFRSAQWELEAPTLSEDERQRVWEAAALPLRAVRRDGERAIDFGYATWKVLFLRQNHRTMPTTVVSLGEQAVQLYQDSQTLRFAGFKEGDTWWPPLNGVHAVLRSEWSPIDGRSQLQGAAELWSWQAFGGEVSNTQIREAYLGGAGDGCVRTLAIDLADACAAALRDWAEQFIIYCWGKERVRGVRMTATVPPVGTRASRHCDHSAAEAAGDKEAGAKGAAHPANVFRELDNGFWEVMYAGRAASALVKPSKGMTHLERLIRRPNCEPLSALDLAGVDERAVPTSGAKEDPEDESNADLQRRLEEVNQEIEESVGLSEERQLELRQEKERIEEEGKRLAAIRARRGAAPKGPLDSAANSVKQCIDRAYEGLKAVHMNDLVQHFEASIGRGNGHFSYNPPDPAPRWDFDPPPDANA